MKVILQLILSIFLAALATACIEDGFTTSPSAQPTFSTDTLDMGLMLTDEGSPTARFVVYNPSDRGISISKISLKGKSAQLFRLNVDGFSGREFQNVEIRARDSIFVLVEALLPATGQNQPQDFEAAINFYTNGCDRQVVLKAQGQDVERLRAVTLTADRTFTDDKPYQIYDSLIVPRGVTLTLGAGARLLMHDGAYIRVYGSLHSQGTVEKPVNICGDRTGNVVSDISFDIMSRQWGGILVEAGAAPCSLKHTDMRNSWYGLVVRGDGSDSADTPALTLVNCRLHNSAGTVLTMDHASLRAAGCEFAEGGAGLVWLEGGQHRLDHCTFGNNYLFAAISGPALGFGHLKGHDPDSEGASCTAADVTNSVFSGIGPLVQPGDLKDLPVTLRHCLINVDGSDDANFISCIWAKDPLYYTVRNEYLFDYRLKPDSPARGQANSTVALPESATDAYGTPRTGTLGAYEAPAPEEGA